MRGVFLGCRSSHNQNILFDYADKLNIDKLLLGAAHYAKVFMGRLELDYIKLNYIDLFFLWCYVINLPLR